MAVKCIYGNLESISAMPGHINAVGFGLNFLLKYCLVISMSKVSLDLIS